MNSNNSKPASRRGLVEHIRQTIPSFDVPSYGGRSYEVMAPDTLDIQQRIALAVNGLTGPTDPDKDYLLYFRVNFRSNPPSMSHGPSDICQIKFMESLPLMRLASGAALNDRVDPVWMKTALGMIGPDGLVYWPTFPWSRYPDWCEPCPKGAKHYSVAMFCGRMIGAMTIYMLRDSSGPWEKEIQKVVHGLRSIAIQKDDYAFFPQGGFSPGTRRVREASLPLGVWASLVGWTIHGLAQYHRVSGFEPAVDLASRLTRYLVHHGRYYGPDGEFLPNYGGQGEMDEGWARDSQGFNPGPPPVNNLIHFQHHMVPLLGTLDHALAVGDANLADFVRHSFEWARTKGNALLGYFPENIDNYAELETSELCEVAGMIGLALKLSAAGLGDYWDDADRWIRNMFAEGQLLRPEWVYHSAEGGMVTSKTRIPPSAMGEGISDIDTSREDPKAPAPMSILSDTCDRVPERNVGAFAGWPTANDWFIGHGSGIMHCCTGNATRALYYIWEHMLTYDRGTLTVNLLLNRPSKWADVHSHIPYTGQVDIVVKRACKELRVRIPEWVTPQQVSSKINGKKRQLNWDKRYALVGPVAGKDEVTMSFPISERRRETDIECQHYHLITRGNEVVDIYPRGRFCPLYQRDYYRTDTTRWKKVQRFVSNESIAW